MNRKTWRDVLGQKADLKAVMAAMDTDRVDMSSYGDVETWLRGEAAHILGRKYDPQLDYHIMAMELAAEILSYMDPADYYEDPAPAAYQGGEYDPWPAYGPEGEGE